MTFLAKCLTAFVLFASVSFLGFAAVVAFGGRNWEAETRGLDEYAFTNSGGENPTWKAERIRDGQVVKESAALPEVVVAALADKVSQQQSELSTLDQNIPKLKQALDESKQLIEADLAAMVKRETALANELSQVNQKIEQVVNQGRVQTQDAQQKRLVGEVRREEVFRLRRQLEEIRTDRFRAEEQKQKLQDALVQLEGSVERLQERNRQLKQRLY